MSISENARIVPAIFAGRQGREYLRETMAVTKLDKPWWRQPMLRKEGHDQVDKHSPAQGLPVDLLPFYFPGEFLARVGLAVLEQPSRADLGIIRRLFEYLPAENGELKSWWMRQANMLAATFHSQIDNSKQILAGADEWGDGIVARTHRSLLGEPDNFEYKYGSLLEERPKVDRPSALARMVGDIGGGQLAKAWLTTQESLSPIGDELSMADVVKQSEIKSDYPYKAGSLLEEGYRWSVGPLEFVIPPTTPDRLRPYLMRVPGIGTVGLPNMHGPELVSSRVICDPRARIVSYSPFGYLRERPFDPMSYKEEFILPHVDCESILLFQELRALGMGEMARVMHSRAADYRLLPKYTLNRVRRRRAGVGPVKLYPRIPGEGWHYMSLAARKWMDVVSMREPDLYRSPIKRLLARLFSGVAK